MRNLCSVLLTILAALSAVGCREKREVSLDLVSIQDQSRLLADTKRIDFGNPTHRARLIGRGWSGDEEDDGGRTFVWAVATEASVVFDLVSARDTTARILCRPFPRTGQRQALSVRLNGEAVGKTLELGQDFQEYEVFLPVRALKAGENQLDFLFAYAGGASQGSSETRSLAACFDDVSFTAYDQADSEAAADFSEVSIGRLGLQPADVLEQPPHSTRTFYIRLPAAGSKPRFEADCLLPSGADSSNAVFTAEIQADGGSARQLLSSELKPGGRKKVAAELSDWAGQTVRLAFSLAGGDATGYWVKPRVTVSAPKTVAAEDPRIADARKKLASSNVLIILLDAASAGHFSTYGYHLPTTPNIDSLAREGVVFTKAFCNAVYTGASTGSLMSGQYPDVHRVLFARNRLPETSYTMAEMFTDKGVATASFVANSNGGTLRGYEQGFKDMVELFRLEEFGSLAVNQNKWLFPWLEQNRSNQFFLYLHLREPHFGGYPPQEFLDRFDTGYKGKIDVLNDREKINRGQRELGPGELEHIVSVYDATLNYADHEVGLIVAKMKELGIWEKTLTFVIADHGEALWEHGYFGHNVQVYQNMAHIPFVVRPPAGAFDGGGRRIDSVVQTVDIYATMADVFGSEKASDQIDGDSILPLLANPERTRDGLAYTRTLWDKPTYGVRDGRWEYVYETRSGNEQLYDLQADHAEKRNLLAEYPIRSAYFKQHLSSWILEQKEKARRISSPADAQMDAADEENLKRLGYIDETGKNVMDEK